MCGKPYTPLSAFPWQRALQLPPMATRGSCFSGDCEEPVLPVPFLAPAVPGPLPAVILRPSSADEALPASCGRPFQGTVRGREGTAVGGNLQILPGLY